jgi:hypothetical protein
MVRGGVVAIPEPAHFVLLAYLVVSIGRARLALRGAGPAVVAMLVHLADVPSR